MTDKRTDAAASVQRSPFVIGIMVIAALLGCGVFLALGSWQLQRRAWKLDLIQRVEARVHQPPIAAPPRKDWSAFVAADWDYRRVSLTGTFLPNKQTLVRALTKLGAGYWVMAPLQAEDGSLTLINRGFVPLEEREREQAASAPSGEVTVTGLLRATEPSGVWPRANDPGKDRWYSRDVAEIAAARALGAVAPYFVDADAAASPGSNGPIGGLTVITFPNNHLVYALTWYALAAMLGGAVVYLVRDRLGLTRRLRGHGP